MADAIAIFPLSNSVAFSPASNNGLTVLRQDNYANCIQGWQTQLPYVQKVVNTDLLTIMVHTQETQNANVASLLVCDQNKQVVAVVNFPYLKGRLGGLTTFTDPVTGATVGMLSSLWAFRFSDLAGDIPDGGVYYLRVDNALEDGVTVVQYYSEPLLVSNTHPDTLLFQFTYNTNNAAKNILIGQWQDGFPGPYPPYGITFGIRAEGYILPSMSGPKGINIGYFQQGYNPVQIKTQQKRFFDLHLGDVSLGVPWYMLEMVTEALMADNVAIMRDGDSNAYPYVLYNGGSSDSLTDIWKVKGSDVNPLLYASCNLMQRSDDQNAFVTPTPVPIGGRVFDGTFDGVFA